MSLVYITNASMNLIVKSLQTKKNDFTSNDIVSNIANDLEEDGFSKKDLNEFFNKSELKDIYNRKMVLKDFEGMLNDIDNNLDTIAMKIREENQKYAYKIKAPSYHFDKFCKWKDSSFNNIKIPTECLSDKNNETIVRQWLKNYQQLEFYELNNKFMQEFNCQEGLKKISLENSGTINFDNYKVNFKEKLKDKKIQLKFLLNGELGDKIANYRYAPKYKIKTLVKYEKDINAKQPILDYHTAKYKLQQIIYNFYQHKYNMDLSFNKGILDAIGFRQCNGCSI